MFMEAKYQRIEQAAIANKGGVENLQALLPQVQNANALCSIPDDRYLSQMAKCIFRAGFVWKIVDYKWPGFFWL